MPDVGRSRLELSDIFHRSLLKHGYSDLRVNGHASAIAGNAASRYSLSSWQQWIE